MDDGIYDHGIYLSLSFLRLNGNGAHGNSGQRTCDMGWARIGRTRRSWTQGSASDANGCTSGIILELVFASELPEHLPKPSSTMALASQLFPLFPFAEPLFSLFPLPLLPSPTLQHESHVQRWSVVSTVRLAKASRLLHIHPLMQCETGHDLAHTSMKDQ